MVETHAHVIDPRLWIANHAAVHLKFFHQLLHVAADARSEVDEQFHVLAQDDAGSPAAFFWVFCCVFAV